MRTNQPTKAAMQTARLSSPPRPPRPIRSEYEAAFSLEDGIRRRRRPRPASLAQVPPRYPVSARIGLGVIVGSIMGAVFVGVTL